MAQITRVPVGLLDFLGLKTQGNNPAILSDTVAPILDLSDFYLADRWEILVETGLNAVGTANVQCVTTVPVGQVWYVKQFGVSTAPLGAGQTLRLQAFASLPGAAAASHLTGALDQAAQATVGEICRASLRGFVATGGTGFGFTPLQNVAGPVNGLAATWLFCRLLR